jgi:ribosome-binding factor A
LRYTPELTFKLDTTIAYGVKISRILHDLLPEPPTEPAESDTSHA